MSDQIATNQQMSPIHLDIGCGPNPLPNHLGVDIIPFPNVGVVFDIRHPHETWPWDDESVDSVHSSHFVEHLTGAERINFFNGLYRIMKMGAQARIICPHWSHSRAYGDPTHQWPPMSDFAFFYLSKQWRDANAPHVGYTCNFDWMLVGVHDPNDQYVAHRNMETKTVFMQRNINTTTDLIATLTKVPTGPLAPPPSSVV